MIHPHAVAPHRRLRLAALGLWPHVLEHCGWPAVDLQSVLFLVHLDEIID
jgi:hypothetical protein